MNFDLDDTLIQLQESSRKTIERSSPMTTVRALALDTDGFDRALWQEGVELGWIGSAADDPQPLITSVAIAEELGRGLVPGPFLPVNVAINALRRGGRHDDLVSDLERGTVLAAWCCAESGTGWDPLGFTTVAHHVGDEVILNGTKTLVQDAHVADWLIVLAASPDGVVQCCVRADAPGVSVEVANGFDVGRRLCRVRFDDTRVSCSEVFGGDIDTDYELWQRSFLEAAVLTCAESVGIGLAVLEVTTSYAASRHQFGRPIGSFQAIKHRCADMLLEIELARSATHFAALQLTTQSIGAAAAVAVAKASVGASIARICGNAIQIHGGMGMTWEHDLHLYLRRARSNDVLYGDPAWHREQLAKTLLGEHPMAHDG